MGSGTRFVDKEKKVHVFKSAVPSSATPVWLSMKGYNHVQFMVMFANATTVTGSAITLNQATNVAGNGSKPLAFTNLWTCANDATNSALTQSVVVNNTFTTSNTNTTNGFYLIEVDADDLDINNGFTAVQIGIGNATAASIDVVATMGNIPRYSGEYGSFREPMLD